MTISSALLVVFVFAVFGLVVMVLRRPDEFRISRSTRIAADPASVFSQINDFRAWSAWSPWAKLDPAMYVEYDGPSRGLGAGYSWSGNSKVGQGSMRIIESKQNIRVGIQLEFFKPFRASNRTTFTLTPEPSGTKVSWVMEGKNKFLSKLMGVFMNLDKLIGADFERGLANLKVVVERGAGSDSVRASRPNPLRASNSPEAREAKFIPSTPLRSTTHES